MNFSDRQVLVLGLGETGLAMAQWLLRGGARLRVADTRTAPERLPALQALAPERVEFCGGEFSTDLLEGIDLVAVSPGLSPLRELAGLLPEAQRRAIPVWGEIELFAQALAALKEERGYAPKLIAITGTNGKTTVTRMTGLLCERAGLSVRVAGNISPAVLDVLREALEQDALPQVWVLELSSFQLQTTFTLQADAATVLNITQDHLDWHGDMAAYCAAKARIFGAATVPVSNRDDALAMALTTRPGYGFSVQAPQLVNSFGLIHEHGMAWLAVAVADEEEPARRRKKDAAVAAVAITRLMPVEALRIRGQHNAANALAALALCRAIGLPFAPLLHGLREYAGEPHRVEHVATVRGIDFIDDSKGTNVGATVAALQGIGQQGAAHSPRIVLIAGGEGKGQDFSPLADPLQRYAKALVLIGKAAPEIRAATAGAGVSVHDCASLEQAVELSASLAQSGDVVLLSPACASLDMFRNYAHRAEVFVAAVREVALASGEVC